MNAVEALKQKAQTSNLAYIKLLQKYRFDTNDLHYIFEGFDDQSFYFNYLQGLTKNYITHISLGKKQSLEIYNKIDWSIYDKRRIIIFIDRDYCRILGEPIPEDDNIYETTYYSIENYISNPEVLKRLIREILHFHEEVQVNQIVTKYEKELELFIKQIRPILAWVLTVRSHKLKANLNMIDLSKLFQINSDLTFLYLKIDKIAYLENVTHVKTPIVHLSGLKHWYNVMDATPTYKLYLRGKFEAWFLITFFNRLNGYLLKNYNHNSKVKTNINHSNALEIIGPRTSIPERFEKFLKQLFP
ncbi:DUF4435 domain-containing protein [Limnovirga soli]|uniref:DUF4435 domain-containing protein n=1 Tax=Limnovirga soli TaxID=2656915 RepID=A0A8J8FEA4_9BACT|nr:DUF4435 domain-containing protein [Limnovirga soli]NNV55027.1 DUF4435 domain-containing protein [Limnovirga soli]